MVASNARALLKKENEMLDDLVQRASAFAQEEPRATEADVFNAWVRELRGHRDANNDLIGLDDAGFERESTKRSRFWKRLRVAITGAAISISIGETILATISQSRKNCFSR